MDKIWQKLAPKEKILILGFGREGLSSYVFIRSHDKERILTIADASADVEHNPIFKDDSHIRFITGKKYLEHLNGFDLILKAPGISLPDPVLFEHRNTLSSQAALFLEAFRDQTIGVTGTKGKSTTSTFIHHFLKLSGKESLLLGNIGVPPFDMLGDIQPETVIVFELSSHMLQTVRVSPHIALALNIFPEHLDYYETMERYVASKAHIFEHQRKEDFLITDDNQELEEIIKKTGTHAKRISWNKSGNRAQAEQSSYDDAECAPLERGGELFIKKGAEEIPFYTLDTKTSVNGHHVLRGLALGAVAAICAGADPILAKQALETFQGLSHRLQNIGVWKGITFINDSISTIPESALAALRAFPKTSVLILGGLDRGISYEKLIATIREMPDLYVLLIDETGERIYAELLPHQADPKKYFLLPDLEAAVKKCYDLLGNGGLVLLSPAAASYSQFKNFEERGKAFEEYAKKYGIHAMNDYDRRKYSVIPYDISWEKEFKRESEKLQEIFPKARIEHIGSTSVAGMMGKPCIDLLVVVDDINIAEIKKDVMEQLGYTFEGRVVTNDAFLFRKMKDDIVFANVHFFPSNHPDIKEMIGLRDYLRSHSEEVKKYSELKHNLYVKYPEDYAMYRKQKDTYMEALKARMKKHYGI